MCVAKKKIYNFGAESEIKKIVQIQHIYIYIMYISMYGVWRETAALLFQSFTTRKRIYCGPSSSRRRNPVCAERRGFAHAPQSAAGTQTPGGQVRTVPIVIRTRMYLCVHAPRTISYKYL